MAIEAAGFISSAVDASSLSGAVDGSNKTDFTSWLDKQLNEVNNQIQASDLAVRKLATGETSNLHEVMISLEKAKLSFELLLQVRNKALEGYQEIMRMQI